MQLARYVERLVDMVQSRRELTIENLRVRTVQPNLSANILGRLRFWDGSLFEFVETVEQRGALVDKTEYAYHYQNAGNNLVFRYDNSPHHPEISTHPHHKHVGIQAGQNERLEAAHTPHLGDVLREIERYLQEPR